MSLVTLYKLKAACERKGWTSYPFYDNVLKKLHNSLMNLSTKQADLILELIDRYRWMDQNQIFSSLIKVLDMLEEERVKQFKRIIAFPVMKPKHEGQSKSGHVAIYWFKAIMPNLAKYEGIKLKQVISYLDLSKEKYEPLPGDVIFLLDDYIGSGDSVKSTVEAILSGNDLIKKEMLHIFSIAVQVDTVGSLESLELPIFYDHVELKGISNYYDGGLREEKINLMLEIESQIPDCDKYKLGYNESEALITLTRTPNNTFPFFWKTIQIKSRYYKAPFPRY